MKFSKTDIKHLTNCPSFSYLKTIYKDRLLSEESIENIEKEEILEMLVKMYESDTGDDLSFVESAQLKALAEKYNEVEEKAILFCKEIFGFDIIASKNIKNQEKIFCEKDEHTFYTYLDGFKETENEYFIFEVKATTSEKIKKFSGSDDKNIFMETENFFKENKPLDSELINKNLKKITSRYDDLGKYLYDLAITKYIFEHSARPKKKTNYFLVVLNSDYRHTLKTKPKEPLFKIIEANNILEHFMDRLDDEISEFILNINKKITPKIGKQCRRKKPDQCPFFSVCWEEANEKGSIFEFINNHNGFKDRDNVKYSVFEMFEKGYKKIKDFPNEFLNRQNNVIQKTCQMKNKPFLDEKAISNALSELKYPLYYLDFESYNSPLPRFEGEKPYSQSVFQYSLHIENKKIELTDKDKNHREFIASSFLDEREELVKKLCDDIDLINGGSVIVYNESFEKTRIKEFMTFFPQYKEKLIKINNSLFDLLKVIKNGRTNFIDPKSESRFNFYDNDLQGSFSIKKVLPVFSPLSYKNLEVKNGTEAILAYSLFEKETKDEITRIRKGLSDYCKLDTYSMAIILHALYKRVKN